MANINESISDTTKIFTLMKQMELIAEDILANRQKLIELDRRRQKNREALRALKTSSTSTTTNDINSPSSEGVTQTWCVYGSSFVRTSAFRAADIIKKEQEDIEKEIETVNKKIKHSTQELAALEGRKGVENFSLKPLTKAEKDAIHKIIAPST